MEKEKNIDTSAIGKALFISIILTFIFILLISLACFLLFINETVLWALVFFSTGLSVILGGLIGFSKVRSRGLLHGGIMGILYIIIMILVRVVLEKNLSPDIGDFSNIAMIFFSGLLGGVLGVNSKKE